MQDEVVIKNCEWSFEVNCNVAFKWETIGKKAGRILFPIKLYYFSWETLDPEINNKPHSFWDKIIVAVALCEHLTDKRWWQNSNMSHHVRDLCDSQKHTVIRVFPKLTFSEFIEFSDKKNLLQPTWLFWTFNTLCGSLTMYHTATKLQVTNMFSKLTPIHPQVRILWIQLELRCIRKKHISSLVCFQ